MAKCKACGAFWASDMRSSKEHRRVWKMVTLAEQNWPELYEFQPEGDDHIRQWLTCKAGQYHHTTFDVPPQDHAMYEHTMKLIRDTIQFTGSDDERPRYVFPKITGENKLTVYKARSWKFVDGMKQDKFHEMAENISLKILPQIIGRTGEELLELSEGSHRENN